MTVDEGLAWLRRFLSTYAWRGTTEKQLQEQMHEVLSAAKDRGVEALREYQLTIGGQHRVDFLVKLQRPEDAGLGPPCRIALELKIQGSANEVERQAQRYALQADVDAVLVATTKNTLAAKLRGLATLGGKPYGVVALRTWA
jgi:hypothetical protein